MRGASRVRGTGDVSGVSGRKGGEATADSSSSRRRSEGDIGG